MSTPRIPPVPPKGGELDKTAPSTQHRRVEKVDKIEKVAEVDDESRARKFRQFVEADNEEPASDLPTPFSLFSVSKSVDPHSMAMMRNIYNPPSLNVTSTSPTPDLAASSSDTGMDEAAQAVVASPDYSPSPSAVLNGTAAVEEESPPPLPRSSQFWLQVDDSSEAKQTPQMEETTQSSSRAFRSKEEEDQEKKESAMRTGKPTKKGGLGTLEKGKEPSPFGLPGQGKEMGFLPSKEEKEAEMKKAEAQEMLRSSEKPGRKRAAVGMEEAREEKNRSGSKEDKAKYVGALPQEGKKEGASLGFISKEELSPERKAEPLLPEERDYPTSGKPNEKLFQNSLSSEQARKLQITRALTREEEELTKGSGQTPSRKEAEKMSKPPELAGLQEELGKEEKEEQKGGKKKSRKEEAQMQIASPTTTPLPDAVIPMAMAATEAATPYLGPETLAVYMQMVGTILVMVSPKGDSRTEFILNAPGFANSKFYGAAISIERFATAPYQINVRLTGSNEAVNLFNKNIPNLMAAFQNGKFSFTINRIDTAYERPLFRRKEESGEKGEKGFGGSMENRKQ